MRTIDKIIDKIIDYFSDDFNIFGRLRYHLADDTRLGRTFRFCKKHMTTFIGLHYIYIISMTFLCSVIIYAERNIRYIDALFFGASACTQAGMNTFLVNDLRFYQQLTLMVFPLLTTPIFIHSSVVFFRLYWYEKYFKNIVVNSKIHSKMRRSATMARAESRDREYGLNPVKSYNSMRSGRNVVNDPNVGQSHINSTNVPVNEKESGTEQGTQPPQRDITFGDLPNPSDRDIRFGELPLPRRQKSVAPQDMYMSINMMQRNRRLSNDDGPALVIKSPRAMDEENERRERQGQDGSGVDSSSPSSGGSNETEESLKVHHKLLRSISHVLPSDHLGVSIDRRVKTLDVPNANNSPDMNEDGTKQAVHKKSSFSRFARTRTLDRVFNRTMSNDNVQKVMSTNYLSWQPTVGRNSNFVDLNPSQKEELGGVEYRALKLLANVLVIYYIGFTMFGIVTFWPYASLRENLSTHFYSQGYTPTLWSFFTSISCFADLGLTLTPESMAFFQQIAYIPLIGGFLIVIGNTGFPVMLRFIIWLLFKVTPKYGHTRESLGFLLDHPRRCFTLLFPSSANWWLFAVLVILNCVDLILFLVLDLTSPAIAAIPVGYRIICGLFQAIATRTAGFTIVSMSDVHPAVRVSYVIMMYISVLPIAISVRRTNVYEEQSLGVYYPEDEDESGAQHHSYVSSHLRRQLSFDLWFIFLGLFIICIAEGPQLENNDFQIFDVLFEIVSAYGTVGVTMGAPGTDLALSGAFNVIGKLVIIAMMIRGRHRGLPYALDRAIIFQSDKLKRTDSIQESRARNKRVMSMTVPIDEDIGMTTAHSINEDGPIRRFEGNIPGIRTETSTLDRFPSQAVSDGED